MCQDHSFDVTQTSADVEITQFLHKIVTCSQVLTQLAFYQLTAAAIARICTHTLPYKKDKHLYMLYQSIRSTTSWRKTR